MSLLTGVVNVLEVVRGSRKTFDITVTPDDASENTYFDLTDAVLVLTVKQSLRGDTILTRTSTDGPLLAIGDNPREGKFAITFASEDTRSLKPGDYVYDCWMRVGGQDTVLIPPSTLRINPSVTEFAR